MRIPVFVIALLFFSTSSIAEIIELKNCWSKKTAKEKRYVLERNVEIDTERKTWTMTGKSKKGEPFMFQYEIEIKAATKDMMNIETKLRPLPKDSFEMDKYTVNIKEKFYSGQGFVYIGRKKKWNPMSKYTMHCGKSSGSSGVKGLLDKIFGKNK